MRGWERIVSQVSARSALGGVAAIAVLLLLATALYVVKPVWAEYREARERSDSAAAPSPEEVARQAERLAHTEAEIRRLRDELYGGAAQVPAREIEAFVIDSLHALADRQRITLLAIDPGQPTEFLSFEELPYQVRLAGRYADLYRWLGQVESELRPMIVKELRLRRDASEGVEMEMRLVAYRANGVGALR